MALFQTLEVPNDMMDKELCEAIEAFQMAILDANVRREMRYMIADTDDRELADAAYKVLGAYVVGEVDPTLPGS